MKKYKLWIRKANIYGLVNKTYVETKIIETDDIYHEIGWIYSNSLEKIERIDYQEIKED